MNLLLLKQHHLPSRSHRRLSNSTKNFATISCYSYDLNEKITRCLTCSEHTQLGNMSYVNAEFSRSLDWMLLSVLGPDLPNYHILQPSTLTTGE